MRHIMPFLMPTANVSIVYFDQRIDVTRTLSYLEKRNAAPQARRMTLFHIMLCAAVRTLAQRPSLNRFVIGRRIYQRRQIELSFALKKQFTDDAPLTTVKLVFEPEDSLDVVSQRVREAVSAGRSSRPTTSERQMALATRLPRSILRLVVWCRRVLDYFNLLPAAAIRSDPLYASMFVANLGSLGLEPAYHHLYDCGTTPLFLTIGRVKKAPVVEQDSRLAVGDVVDLRISFDERVCDGLYCARSLDIFKAFVEDPELLEQPANLTPGSSSSSDAGSADQRG